MIVRLLIHKRRTLPIQFLLMRSKNFFFLMPPIMIHCSVPLMEGLNFHCEMCFWKGKPARKNPTHCSKSFTRVHKILRHRSLEERKGGGGTPLQNPWILFYVDLDGSIPLTGDSREEFTTSGSFFPSREKQNFFLCVWSSSTLLAATPVAGN